MKSMVCPRCKGKLVTQDDEVYVCPYCDYQEVDFDVRNRRLELEAEKQKAENARLAKLQQERDEKRAQRTDKSGNTLIVHYSTVNPSVNMVVRLANSRQKDIMTDGQTLKFRLPPGQYVIVLKIGKINHNRTFIVPKSKEYVEITASWTGRPGIIVDQPEAEEELQASIGAQNQNAPNMAGAAPAAAGAVPNAPKPVQPVEAKPEKDWEDMTYLERIFRKKVIPQWIVAGVLLLMGLTEFMVSPFGAILMLLGAAIISPAVTEYASGMLGGLLGGGKRVPIKIACFVLGGILALIGMIMAGKNGATANLYNIPQATSEKIVTEVKTPTSEEETSSELDIDFSNLFEKKEKSNLPETPHITMEEGDYKIETGHTYAYMLDEWNVYIATPISDSVIKVEHWDKTLASTKEMSFNKEIGTYKITDSENGFYWVDKEHTAFGFIIKDKGKMSLINGKSVVFSINVSDVDECKGTDYDESIACYYYTNDDWHEYRAILLTDNLLKVEVWSRTNTEYDILYGYDLFFINLDEGLTDFEWGDDTHAAFTITMNDPENSYYWKGDKFTSFVLKNKDYEYATVSDYLGL